ncbi:CocE/NonD family hydrolase [Actinoplanes sp. NPDC000266]
MRDGIRLATDVYLPEADRSPAVLVRLPYDKNSRYVFMETVAKRLTARGYTLVVQDVRGKYRSEGEPLGPLNEVRDGYDTIDWVSKQPWCDGRVGMFGDSYYGFTQWAAVSANHPALRAIVPRVTSMRIPLFDHLEHGTVTDLPWLQFVTYIAQCWTGKHIHDAAFDWDRLPLTDVYEQFFREVGERSSWYDLMVPRVLPVPVYPEGHPSDARPVPALHCVGWFDNVATYSMRDYLALTAKPGWAPLQYLYADSTDHENFHLDNVPIRPEDNHDSNDDALDRMMVKYLGPAIDFFDVFLAEKSEPSTLPRVRWHLGHVGYRDAASWPPPQAKPQTLHLGTDELLTEAPDAAEIVTWNYDPQNLPKSTIGDSFAFILEYPDEAVAAEHPDVVCFDGPVADAPIDLAGSVDLYVRVSSTAPTTDVFAKLCDRTPSGEIRQIVRGQGLLTTPGPDGLARIELGHTGYRLRPGHRLHLQISSSDYPEFPPNSGSDADRWTAIDRRPSVQTLHAGHLVVHTL